jgi:putative transposase
LLTESDFATWCKRLGLSKDAEAVVRHIRSSPPSRRVGGGRNNVTGQYPSRKMGFNIQFESHTVEFPLVLQLEHDDDVLEYYCQPPPVELEYAGPSGRRVVARHTADYFVLRRNRAGWIEAKLEEQLPILAAKSPNRFRLVEDRWECPAGKEFAEPLGLRYELHSSAYISPTFVRNAQFLDDYLRVPHAVPSASVEAVLDCLAADPVINLEELIEQTKDIVSPDAIYQMIAAAVIHVDLNAAPLVEPERVRVFADSDTAVQFHAAANNDCIDIGLVDISHDALLLWDGKPWKVVNLGTNNVSLLGENKVLAELPLITIESLLREGRIVSTEDRTRPREHSELQKRLAKASKRDLEIATKRAKKVQTYLNPDAGTSAVGPNRTLRRWISHYLKAQQVLGNGYIGLIPQISERGNRSGKISDETKAAMINFIKDKYETLVQPTKLSSWQKFRDEREIESLPYPSYRTFCTAIDSRPRHERTVKRKGHRAAYKEEEFYWKLDQQTPRHGDRPFEIAHIDHTLMDEEFVSKESGKGLHRAWLTIMVDAFSRRFLAHHVTFDEPSYRSCMMVMRDCVRRHGRLPQIIVVDHGPEFKSTYFDSVIAEYEMTKKTRPPAKARFGGVCERLFGTTNTQFLHNLRGNTQIMKEVRQVTKSNNPRGLAIWDLQSFNERLKNYLYEVYDTIEHAALGQSPRDAFEVGLQANGIRSHRYIRYDAAFLMATSPSTAKGSAKVFPACGVTINYFSYWSEAFRDPTIQNQQVPVRYDPYDMGVAWAYVRGRWVECHSQFYSEMKGRTEKEVKVATVLMRQKMRLHSKGRMTVTATKLARFLRNVEGDEGMLLQRLRDCESRYVHEHHGSDAFAENPEVSKTAESEIANCIEAENESRELEIYGAL